MKSMMITIITKAITMCVIDKIRKILDTQKSAVIKRRSLLMPSLFSEKSVIIVIMYRYYLSANRSKIKTVKM